MKEFLFPQAAGDALWGWIGSPLSLLICWLVLINLAAFLLMWSDKRRAKRSGARRIRERTLFLSALLGGSAGAILGMWAFRHKTRHWYFVWGMPAILAAQIALGAWVGRVLLS